MNYLVAFGILIGVVSVASDICKSPCTNGICVFHVEVELTAGQLGKKNVVPLLHAKEILQYCNYFCEDDRLLR